MRIVTRAILGAIFLALVLGATMANADTQWAVTASQDKVFVVKYDGTALTSSSTPAAYLPGASLAGVAVWKDYVFVADSTTPQATLHVGRLADALGTPRIDWINDVPLKMAQDSSTYLATSGAVAVDANGGVYVLGDNNYAYIPYLSGWSQSNLAIAGMTGGFLRDVDAGGLDLTAMIAAKDTGSDHSLIAPAFGGIAGLLASMGDGGCQPKGIAKGTNGLSYMVNWTNETGEGVWPPGSVSVINNSLLGSVAAVLTPDFQPNDVSFFTRDGINYLGLVGITTGGTDQAWRVRLDDNGLPMMDSILRKTLSSSQQHSNDQYCAVSADGMLFWVTDPGFSTVTVIGTDDNWQGNHISVLGQPNYIATYVPEPTSLVALLTGVVGLIGLKRRRR